MPKAAGQPRLKVEQAARLIYQTDTPTVSQISKIRFRLAEGLLVGDVRSDWVTAESVAAFMAARAQKENERRFHNEGRAHLRSNESGERLPRIYRQLLRDYFTAVIQRKQPRGKSVAFQRAVLAGQIAFILFPIVVLCSIWMSWTRDPEEQQAVAQWVSQEFEDVEILEWLPVPQDGTNSSERVRVKFKYFDGGSRAIITDRLYQVDGDEVREVIDND